MTELQKLFARIRAACCANTELHRPYARGRAACCTTAQV
eukprot:CAMPEP_0202414830 /NCGR_PEP_ID=MMETSP1128-20130828/34123_1 /ASSEMBLY_ACC=CAM_ASM_000463 /TAXON_ID=3047 /ORGANISM="Dunaliella tertiolecta, Strain CCMP1320" /LENGTH=38 /DNA_ID= /DNA_START= /DNA_END= /DNA_ORIENTATION=